MSHVTHLTLTSIDGHQLLVRPLSYAFGDAAMAWVSWLSWLGWGVSPLPPPEGGLFGVELKRLYRLDDTAGDDNRIEPKSSTDDNKDSKLHPMKSSFA